MRYECRMGYQAALNATAVGEQVSVLPQSTEAMREGRIGFAHLALMASTAESVRESPTSGAFDETRLLRQAEKHSVGRFRKDCAHARHAADAEGYLAEQVDLVEARSLEFLPRGDGALILKGFLDAEGGATLRTALEPLARRMDAADDRERERRLADALVELAGHNLDAGLIPQRAGQRPYLQVTASVETLQGAAGAPAGELEFSAAPIAGATVQRLACDAGATRVRWDRTPQWSTWAARGGCRRPRPAGPLQRAIVVASGPAASVPHRGPQRITCSTGPRAGTPTWPIWCWSAIATTGRCTRAAGNWCAVRTKRCLPSRHRPATCSQCRATCREPANPIPRSPEGTHPLRRPHAPAA